MNWLELELDDDPALLDAALLMLDTVDDRKSVSSASSFPDGELDVGGTSGSSDGEELRSEKTASPASSAVVATPPKAKKTRNRRKDELVYLKDKVNQLEQTLTTLKRRRVEDELAVVPTRGHQAVWKQLAGRQQQQRRVVELENARLREMVNTQLQVGKELMRALQKGGRQDPGSRNLLNPNLPLFHVDVTDEERLRRLDELYRLTCNSMTRVVPDPSGATVRDIKIHQENAQTTFVNFVVAWTLPFSTAEVLDALWKVFRKPNVKPGQDCEHYYSDQEEDEICGGFRLHSGFMARKKIPSEIVGRKVAKRFPRSADGDGVVLSNMWAKCISPDLRTQGLSAFNSPTMTGDVQFNEDSWFRIQDARGDGQVWSDEPLTQVQNNRQIRFHVVTDEMVEQELAVGVLTDIVLAYVEEELMWTQQTIENVLFTGESNLQMAFFS
ncbi:hypothetical protein Poli38472_004913 [Pythium oligandrum]|uniref:Uncharacterized protein n=1 Tax=Pythium oligandrum TaxID=41045 RepID=A0A8K1CAN7_PYTOL|nr:hypothetical protein Poli38472_004913 [Pythium oligandrum]|eukprot:TMW59844.1 hypothetical protein Poli38472_004913 [Pythium oligandrum]